MLFTLGSPILLISTYYTLPVWPTIITLTDILENQHWPELFLVAMEIRSQSLMNISVDEGYCTRRQRLGSSESLDVGFKFKDVTSDDDRFIHINDWFEEYGVNPCSKTETIILHSCRSEEPVQSNMDISTGHIVLVSIVCCHDEVMTWKHFPHYWLFVRECSDCQWILLAKVQ